MAKTDASGTVTAFLHSKFKQDNYRTVVELAKPQDAAKLIGARVVWARADGLKILGRVQALHGRKGALRVMWDRGFPPQELGTPVKIVV
jgi:ribosomal protein L35AE/L33A